MFEHKGTVPLGSEPGHIVTAQCRIGDFRGGDCLIYLSITSITVCAQNGKTVGTWPYNSIRDFSCREGNFSFTSGRRGPFGVGTYHFQAATPVLTKLTAAITVITGAQFGPRCLPQQPPNEQMFESAGSSSVNSYCAPTLDSCSVYPRQSAVSNSSYGTHCPPQVQAEGTYDRLARKPPHSSCSSLELVPQPPCSPTFARQTSMPSPQSVRQFKRARHHYEEVDPPDAARGGAGSPPLSAFPPTPSSAADATTATGVAVVPSPKLCIALGATRLGGMDSAICGRAKAEALGRQCGPVSYENAELCPLISSGVVQKHALAGQQQHITCKDSISSQSTGFHSCGQGHLECKACHSLTPMSTSCSPDKCEVTAPGPQVWSSSNDITSKAEEIYSIPRPSLYAIPNQCEVTAPGPQVWSSLNDIISKAEEIYSIPRPLHYTVPNHAGGKENLSLNARRGLMQITSLELPQEAPSSPLYCNMQCSELCHLAGKAQGSDEVDTVVRCPTQQGTQQRPPLPSDHSSALKPTCVIGASIAAQKLATEEGYELVVSKLHTVSHNNLSQRCSNQEFCKKALTGHTKAAENNNDGGDDDDGYMVVRSPTTPLGLYDSGNRGSPKANIRASEPCAQSRCVYVNTASLLKGVSECEAF